MKKLKSRLTKFIFWSDQKIDWLEKKILLVYIKRIIPRAFKQRKKLWRTGDEKVVLIKYLAFFAKAFVTQSV